MIFEPYAVSALSVSTIELSLVSGTSSLQTVTTDGVYQLWVDAANMAKADEFRVKAYEKVLSTGTKRVFCQWTLLGAQAEIFCTPSFILIAGWDFTLTKIAGTDRAFDASIRQIA